MIRPSVFHKFEEMEQRLELFNLSIDDVPVWERVRHNVIQEVLSNVTGRSAHDNSTNNYPTILKKFRLWINNIFQHNPFISSDKDIVFWGHERRKKMAEDKWWDIYFDTINETLENSYVHLEGPFKLTHKTPPKTDNIKYIDTILFTGSLLRKIGIFNININENTMHKIRNIEKYIRDIIGVDIDVESIITREMNNRKFRLNLYKTMLKSINPSIAVIVVSYNKETFIEACKELGIPVIELQHGTIHKRHFAYSYPEGKTKKAFPDYFLTWGRYWNDKIRLPLKDNKIVPVGFPYIERFTQRSNHDGSSTKIVFLSQKTIGSKLSQLAVELSEKFGNRYSILYKLHPEEYTSWREDYNYLEGTGIEIIGESEQSLYELFSGAKAQVGVYSSAVFEGLYFGLETFIFYCDERASLFDDLHRKEYVRYIYGSEDLVAGLKRSNENINKDYLFEPNAVENINGFLQNLVE
ncbi:hypothetical protein [Salinibacter ruber]|uniref:hypothetical protein n=1 Tax=Salinibacter ruber TaxID=146919 RepID=UPI002166FA05|nr:hypothetical protein [Salinibacter ruber]MCS4039946.1 hypothetical protein [Salinibacter ruber]